MKYVKPFNETDPNASYVNGNPGAGVEGSIPDALSFEAPLRELHNLITFAGLTPSNTDLTQVWQAIQALITGGAIPSAALVHRGTDTNAAANVIACDVSPAVTAYEGGAVFVIKMTETNTAAVTANFNSLGSKSVLNSVGGALAAGDLVAGSEYILVYNGTALVVIGLVPSQIPAALPPSASPPRNLVTLATPGSGTFTVPASITWLSVRLVGGGGGGAGGNGGSNWAGAGGGSGGYAEGWIAVTPGQTISYTVGAGGAGGPNSSGATGTAGGTTSFGSFMTATGGGPGSGGPPTSAGGAAGQGTGGQLASYGAPGGDGSASTNLAPGGAGGSSAFGGGGRTSTLSNGAPDGKAFGSGGGGIWGTGGPSAVGGAGAPGAILISY